MIVRVKLPTANAECSTHQRGANDPRAELNELNDRGESARRDFRRLESARRRIILERRRSSEPRSFPVTRYDAASKRISPTSAHALAWWVLFNIHHPSTTVVLFYFVFRMNFQRRRCNPSVAAGRVNARKSVEKRGNVRFRLTVNSAG